MGTWREVVKKRGYSYLLHLPTGYPGEGLWPTLVFLHGVGERGRNLQLLFANGVPKVAAAREDFPFLVVSPQCPSGQYWLNPPLLELLGEVLTEHRADPDRVFLTGLSMGGYGTWSFAAEHPERLAAIAPVCGGGDPRLAGRLRKIPVWAFHGARDPVVPLRATLQMVRALERCGGDVRLTVYPEAGHDSWTQAYDTPELYGWFLDRRRHRVSRG